MKIIISFALLIIAVLVPLNAPGADVTVSGVFGLSGVEEASCVAVWVPVDSGASVSGLKWFNNDSSTVFPEFLAVAGNPNYPEQLSDATVVGTYVAGASSGWSEYTFDQPLGSETSGLYFVFRLPTGSDYVQPGVGGGAGFGYWVGNGDRRSWISGDGVAWNPLSVDLQMAVEPIVSVDKSRGILFLRRPERYANQAQREPTSRDTGLVATPNPFNPSVDFRYNVMLDGQVDLRIYNLRGHAVRTLRSGFAAAGDHIATWDGRDGSGREQASGVYLVRFQSETTQTMQRITLVR